MTGGGDAPGGLVAVGGGLPHPVELGRPDRRTHISNLWFVDTDAGPMVCKAKQAVRFRFADLTHPDARAEACRREVELNRRLSPEVYLGVAELRRAGAVVDHAVVMRRLPDDRRLAALVAAGAEVRDGLRDVLHRVVALHGRHRVGRPAGPVPYDADGVAAQWRSNLSEATEALQRLRSRPPGVTGPGRHAADGDFDELEVLLGAIGRLAERYLAGRAALFERRIADGWVVDGHGDLLAEDIFLLDDGPAILDCLEFDDALRIGDALADVAFLAMDLERLGHPELGRFVLETYRELAADPFPATLADHWVALRALVRAKVALLAAGRDGPDDRPAEAVALARLAHRHLVAAQVHLVLVGGPPATGKSTLAARLAEQRGWVVLRSDELRKDLAGLAHTARAAAPVGEGLYTEATTRATYTELTRRARRLLELGESVILDASFSAAVHRAAARQAAARAGAWCTELVCRAEPEVVEARLARRAADHNEVSDATVEVAEAIRARFEPWPEATVLDTAAPVTDVLAAASAAIEATVGEAAPRRPASPVGDRAAACGPD